MFYRFTAVCRDRDADGIYRHIVRRFTVPAGKSASFTRKCNAVSRNAPATNPEWNTTDGNVIG